MPELTYKTITIPFAGPIYPKGGVMGPILSKHAETLDNIGLLLQRNYPVTEHLEDGEQVELTLSNFRNNFNAVEEPKVEEKKPVVEAPEKKPEAETPEKNTQNNQQRHQGKKDKKDRGNNNRVEDPTQSK